MVTKYKLPALGENIEKAQVIGVLVSPGDRIEKDQSVIEVETDKASLEVPSPASGRVTELFVKKGDTIEVGKEFISIDAEGGQGSSAPAAGARAEPSSPKAAPAEKARPRAAASEELRPARRGGAPRTAAPAASGAEEEPSERPPAPAAPPSAPAPDGARRAAFAAPSVRRFAREIGVNIDEVPGSGPGGRISIADVKEFARATREEVAAHPARELEPGRTLEFQPGDESFERRPLSNVRRTIAERMSLSWSTVPHVTLHTSADVTEVEKVRRRYKARLADEGRKITITSILLKVVASALKVFPEVNASLDAEQGDLLVNRSIHVGVAVDTERGLLVPVVRDADRKNILELSADLAQVSEKAHAGKLKPDEMKGSGFTLTNLGGLGIGEFTPIINPPQVAVLGVGRAREVLRLEEGELVTRLELPLSLSIDHRVLDGADGARFLQWIVRALEDPLVMALEG